MAKKKQIEIALRKAIKRSGLTQTAIADATGVPQSTLSRFIQGSQTITLAHADVLASFFGIVVLDKPKNAS